jgi:hypothetical protein
VRPVSFESLNFGTKRFLKENENLDKLEIFSGHMKSTACSTRLGANIFGNFVPTWCLLYAYFVLVCARVCAKFVPILCFFSTSARCKINWYSVVYRLLNTKTNTRKKQTFLYFEYYCRVQWKRQHGRTIMAQPARLVQECCLLPLRIIFMLCSAVTNALWRMMI